MEEKIINVSFDACGGEVDIESLSYKSGELFGNLPKPERKGHIFDGWYTETPSFSSTSCVGNAMFTPRSLAPLGRFFPYPRCQSSS